MISKPVSGYICESVHRRDGYGIGGTNTDLHPV